jgi:uncharacterized membrane protein YqjE
MEEPGDSSPGVVASVQRLLKTVLAIAHNRLELFLIEAQEERWRLFQLLLLLGVVLILSLTTLMAVIITVIVVCLEAERMDVVIGLVLLFLAATIFSFWRLNVCLKQRAPFAGTLAEMEKDKACFLDDKN